MTLIGNPDAAEVIARLCGERLPEERLIIGGIGWEGYLALDAALASDRSGPRLYFHDGDVELVSTSDEHERIKKWIADCLADFLFEKRIQNVPRGQATMRLVHESGAEPDESWCLGEAKTYPDIVLEIALTSGGLPKLEIYRRFAIPEVWIWRRGRLEIHLLRDDRSVYDEARASHLLPGLPILGLERAVATPDWIEARLAFRAAFD